MIIERRVTSEATPDQVWAVLSDLDAWPQWLPTVTRLEREDPDAPHGVGAAYLLDQPKLRRARWVITQWSPGANFTWATSASGFTMTATHQLSPTSSGGTEIALGIATSGPLSPVLGLLYGRLTRRYIETEAASLASRAAE